jgi:hypothetical protein
MTTITTSLSAPLVRSESLSQRPISQIQASPFSTLSDQLNLHFADLQPSVGDLLQHMYVATSDAVTTRGIGRYERVSPSQEQLSDLVNNLNQLAMLPTGKQILKQLCALLETNNQKLCFSFILDEGTTPLCKPSFVEIAGNPKDCYAFIRLPKTQPESCNLPFYNVMSGTVLQVPEPHFITIGHELLHGIQNLQYPSTTSVLIQQELDTHFSSLLADCSWYARFFAGSDGDTWPDELQAMVLGIEVEIEGHKVRLSEANLMQEWLSGQHGSIPRELAQYTGHTLVPFGHLGPQDEIKPADMQNFCALLQQSGLFGKVHEPILPKRCQVA